MLHPYGSSLLFFSRTVFLNLVKMQIPRTVYANLSVSFRFVWRQLGFAFFGALTPVGALFIFITKGAYQHG